MEKRFADVEISGTEVDKANYALSIGKTSVALELMQRVLSERPDNSVALWCLANIYYKQRRYPEAENTILESLRQDPQYSGAHQMYAKIARKLGNYDLADKAYQTAIEAKPTNWDAYILYADFLLEIRKNPAAARYYMQAPLEHLPEDMRTHYIFALILSAENNLDGAETAFKQALSIKPNNASLHDSYGLFLLNKRKDPNGAFAHFRLSLMLDPNNVSYRNHFFAALKSRHPVYWLFLQYTALKRTLRRYGIGLTLLLAVLVRAIYTITLDIPGLQPVGLIIGLLWVLLFLYTITINPIFNFMIKRGLIK